MKAWSWLLLLLPFVTAARTRTLVVAQDGSGQFTTVQAAFDALPADNSQPVTIIIKPGIYRERLHLQAGRNKVHLKGLDRDRTVLVYHYHSGLKLPNGDTINTFTSQTFLIEGDDFSAEDLTFQNDAGYSAGQAVAVSVTGDRARFRNCRLLAFQDTLYLGGNKARQYFDHCYIEGTTDFIFGPATALFDSCVLHSKRNSHVTAASTPQEVPFGFVFRNCVLTADTGINKVTLGRPWRPYAQVAYLNCTIGSHIIAAGWDNWRNAANEQTARYAEYRNGGAGAPTAERVSWSRQLTNKEAATYTTKNILRGWKPATK